jgi:pimeloyl-ACP methyl ester carboxylesterase
MEKILFIHGLGEQAKDYRSFSRYFDIYNINWNRSLIDQVVKIPREYSTIVGFSWGAIVACLYAGEFPVKLLILCSLPAGVDASYMAGLKAEKVVFLFGEKEKWTAEDNRRVAKRMKKQYVRRVIMPKEGHRITKPYLKTILQAIKESESTHDNRHK